MPDPVLLRPDNFTPPTRTPWGGRRLRDTVKRNCPLEGEAATYSVVGESWELSVTPELPSLLPSGETLAEHIRRDPAGWLGEALAQRQASTALLVKLLDAADNLSVQIHPRDDFRGLAPGESGKPESWYVVEASPGAGLYLGLRDGVTRGAMEEALHEGQDVSPLLHFVPVAVGDFFAIPAGTAHAIGKGVTLVEPQRVLPGRRGVTYRYWDWNRRYDAAGAPDPSGAPRPLHVEEALAVTDWGAPREARLLELIRLQSGPPSTQASPILTPLCGPSGPVLFDSLAVARCSGTGETSLEGAPRLRSLTVLSGAVELGGQAFSLRVPTGYTAALPAGLSGRARLEEAHAIIAAADALT